MVESVVVATRHQRQPVAELLRNPHVEQGAVDAGDLPSWDQARLVDRGIGVSIYRHQMPVQAFGASVVTTCTTHYWKFRHTHLWYTYSTLVL